MRNFNSAILSILIILTALHCASVPEKIPEKKILNNPKIAELRPLQREVVKIYYDIKDQEKRESEFELAYNNEINIYDNLKGDEKKSEKAILDKTKLKARIEREKRILLQLKLRERIALLELKKATVLALDSSEPVELASYEKYHKAASDDVASQEKKVKSLEIDYANMPATGENK